MKFCENCNKNIMPIKKFSVKWFLIDLLTIVGGGIYIIYYLFFKKKSCPICGCKHLEHENDNIIEGECLPKLSKLDIIAENTESNKEKWKSKLEISKQKGKINEDNLSIAKAQTAETIRKRKAGELPWQIAKAEKKLAKLNKIS